MRLVWCDVRLIAVIWRYVVAFSGLFYVVLSRLDICGMEFLMCFWIMGFGEEELRSLLF